MNYKVFFSPTGGTRKVVEYMGEKFADPKEIDLSFEISDHQMTEKDFCIVGVPSFGGRVPGIAVQRLRKLHGKQTPALLIVTYGNRAYEDTLRELKDVLEEQGFLCIGAAAIVTQHSIMPQFGAGRPDADDYAEMNSFAEKIKDRLQKKHQSVKVPGNVPYKEFRVVPMQPQVTENCGKCGLCAKECPVQAISLEDPQIMDVEKCISCMRCVSICPVHARKCEEEKIKGITEKLKEVCSDYKMNEFF